MSDKVLQCKAIYAEAPIHECSPGLAIRRMFAKYSLFHGRASRTEMFWGFAFVVATVFGVHLTGELLAVPYQLQPNVEIVVLWLDQLYRLALAVPCISLACRRFHDMDITIWALAVPLAFAVVLSLIRWLYFSSYYKIMLHSQVSNPPNDLLGLQGLQILVLAILVLFAFFQPSKSTGVRFDRSGLQ